MRDTTTIFSRRFWHCDVIAPPVVRKFIGYFGTGGCAAIVDAGGFWALNSIGAPTAQAAIASFCSAAVVNYIMSSLLVFGAQTSLRRFLIFFSFAALGLVLNTSITLACISAFPIPPVLAKVMAIGIVFVVNFYINVTVVFRK